MTRQRNLPDPIGQREPEVVWPPGLRPGDEIDVALAIQSAGSNDRLKGTGSLAAKKMRLYVLAKTQEADETRWPSHSETADPLGTQPAQEKS